MIELLSLHIPKTAGMTFLDILQQQYGSDACLHVRHRTFKRWKSMGIDLLDKVEPETRVVHGHVRFRQCRKLYRRDRPPVIAWLRNPIDRVVSRFYFAKWQMGRNPNHPQIHRKDEDLLTFARTKPQINLMYRYLDGIDLDDLFFFGFQETFEEDLAILARKLNWKPYTLPRINDNRPYRSEQVQPDPKVLEEINHLNDLDMAIYERALRSKTGREFQISGA